MDVTIRRLKEKDLPQVAIIENKTAEVPWTDAIFKDCLHAGYPAWVMEQAGKVVSFTIIALHGDECHLLNISVHPNFQRKGLGQQMLEFAVQAAKDRGALIIYLEVRESNNRAIALYQKMGFSQVGVRKDYYPGLNQREDALVFVRDLGAERR